MAPIVVDPEVLAGAGVSVSSVGDEIAAAVNTLAGALPNGAMTGHDRAGLAFGQAYQQSAQALMDAAGAAAGGGRKVGFGVQLSATNYSRADVSSMIGGAATPLAPPATPGEFDAPSVPSPFGGGVAEPFLWSMVQMFVGDVWPNGDPAQLRTAGTAWSAFSRSMAGIAGQLVGPSSTISGQQIPEGGAMAAALSDLKQGLAGICTESAKLGVQLFEFATDVESAQNAIRDLLSRLSPSGIFDAIGAVFSGDAMEELREIADDIRAVLDNLGRQADAREHALQEVTNLLDGAIVSLQLKARKEFTDFLGEDVGNAVATYFDINTNVLEAPLKVGLETIGDIQALDPLRFAYDFEGAKETWGAMGESLLYANPMTAAMNPVGAFEHQKNAAESILHLDEWSTDRPGLGPAMATTEIASMLIPGAGASKATKAADVAGDIADAGPAVRAAGVVDNAVTDTAAIAGRAEGITDKLDNIGDNLVPNATPDAPGPAIPRDLAESPGIGDAPTPVPRAPDTPPPHVPDSTPGDRTPVAPHNSAPTEAPRAPVDAGPRADAPPTGTSPEMRTPAADVPADSQHSAPPPPGSAPPASTGSASGPQTHLPETAPAAGHEPSAAGGQSPSTPTESSARGDSEHHAPENSPPQSPTDPSAGTTSDAPDHNQQPSQPGDSHDSGDSHHGHDAQSSRSNDDELREMRPWDRERVDRAINPDELEQHLIDSGVPREIAASAADSPYTGMTSDELLEKYWDSENHRWNWPPHDGFKDGQYTVADRIPTDVRVDRIGLVNNQVGDFMAAEGDIYPSRGLAPGTSGDYNVFAGTGEPIPPGWEVRYGETGEAFDQPGGGTQWVVVDENGNTILIQTLIDDGYLAPISGPAYDSWMNRPGGAK